jgi:hypothetical protein
MFDPRDPYERCYWHYDSRRPLSLARLISLGSVDADTAALVWLLLECSASFTIAGPTDPKPGVGKTTVLNALLQCLPSEAKLAYTAGIYEDFAFTHVPGCDPSSTYVLCNEISDHQPFYMWGRKGRQYLQLASQGYHIGTTVHADTIDDVLYLFQHELRLSSEVVSCLGLIVHIGLVGQEPTVQRRWLSVHFLLPDIDPRRPNAIVPMLLSQWNERDDCFVHTNQLGLDRLARWASMTRETFIASLKQRIDCLKALALQPTVSMDEMYEAITWLRANEKRLRETYRYMHNRSIAQ